MRRYLSSLLFIGLAFGENNFDLLIFKNGLQYHGKFLKIQNNMIYFKPKDSPDYQNVFTYQLDRVELKNGEVLNFKDVKKTIKTITKEIDKTSTLLLKKGKKILEFDSGQRLIINNDIKGVFESMTKDYLSIGTGNAIAEKISLSSITKITVRSKIPANISFIKGSCSGAGIGLILIGIMAYDDPLYLIGVPGFAMVGAFLGGLASYIVPKFRKTKGYLIQNDEWKIVND